LMIHGSADDFVPCSMSHEGYEACTSSKELFLVEGAGHGVSFLFASESYTEKILFFLKNNVEEFS